MQIATITTVLTLAKGHVFLMWWQSCPPVMLLILTEFKFLLRGVCKLSFCALFVLFCFLIFPPSFARTHTFYLSIATSYWGLSLIHVESTAHKHLLNGPTETLIPLLTSAIQKYRNSLAPSMLTIIWTQNEINCYVCI